MKAYEQREGALSLEPASKISSDDRVRLEDGISRDHYKGARVCMTSSADRKKNFSTWKYLCSNFPSKIIVQTTGGYNVAGEKLNKMEAYSHGRGKGTKRVGCRRLTGGVGVNPQEVMGVQGTRHSSSRHLR